MITVRMVKYSAPARFIGRKVGVALRASEIVVLDGRTVVARHQRIIVKHGQVQLDHYREVLQTKPGALPGSTALARVRGGLSTKLHALVDGKGRPLVLLVAPGRGGMRRCLPA